MKILQFSNLIYEIWCILFGNILNRRKDQHLDDSPFSDNLNRIDIRSSYDRYGLILEYMKYRSYILISQYVHCHRVFSGFSVSSSSLLFFFQALTYFRPLCVFYDLLTVLRGCFTPIGLIHLSQSLALLSSPFLSFFSSFFFLLFSFFPPFFSLFLSLSPCRFWCGDRRHAAPLPTGLLKRLFRHTIKMTCSKVLFVHQTAFRLIIQIDCCIWCKGKRLFDNDNKLACVLN